jgi:tryptophan synthase alpha subunit
MITRIGEVFVALRAREARALIPYFAAGDPSLSATRRLVAEAARRGADLTELGVPFSDLLADGVGFGIATPAQAALVGLYADGVIVGSAIVHLVEQYAGSPELLPRVGDFIAALKAPLRGS